MTELAELAAFTARLKWEDVPEHVKQETANRVLDTIGAAIAAAKWKQVQDVSDLWCSISGEAQVSVWGQARKIGLFQAVFLNALMGHSTEMDDVHTGSKAHIGTVVIPAAWGLAEYLKVSGKELLLAVLCGYEVTARLGKAFGVTAHRGMGWHATSTCGVFGAAAACAKLLGLDEEKTLYALALAGAQSFGTWAFLKDGASCKVLNPARAAQSGLEAAMLAKAGMTGAEHILTAEDGGLFSVMSSAPDISMVSHGLGSVWEILAVDVKPYPACRSTHCTIDGTKRICREHQVDWKNIERVEVETYEVGYKQCGLAEGSIHPTKAIHAKFSSPFTVAAAAIYGNVSMRHFEEDIINDSAVQDLLKRVTIRPSRKFSDDYPEHWGCQVRMFLKSGEMYETYVRDASGSVENPLTEKEIREKAVDLMKPVIGKKAEIVADELENLRNQDKIPEL